MTTLGPSRAPSVGWQDLPVELKRMILGYALERAFTEDALAHRNGTIPHPYLGQCILVDTSFAAAALAPLKGLRYEMNEGYNRANEEVRKKNRMLHRLGSEFGADVKADLETHYEDSEADMYQAMADFMAIIKLERSLIKILGARGMKVDAEHEA